MFGYVEQTFHQVSGTVRDQITLFDPAITPEMAEEAARLAGLHETVMALEKGYDMPCMDGIFQRDSGNFCRLQGQWRQDRRSFYWMRSRQIWMHGQKKKYYEHCREQQMEER